MRDLLAALPDELWVVQITPSAIDRLPRTLTEIVDRRGELSGNLSLYQELAFVETLNRLIDDGRLQPGGEIGRTVVRVIELPREVLPRALGAASKSDRSPAFLQRLIDSGREQAEKFLGALAFERAWSAGDTETVRGLSAPGASLVAGEPFGGSAREAVHDVLGRDVRPDLAHKQVSGDSVTWAVHAPGVDAPCVARATFDGRKVSELRLGRRAD